MPRRRSRWHRRRLSAPRAGKRLGKSRRERTLSTAAPGPAGLKSRRKGGFECAHDRRSAFASPRCVTDDNDLLSRAEQTAELLAGRRATSLIEPIAERRRRKQLPEARPVPRAEVEQHGRNPPKAKAVACAGRNHDTVERRQQIERALDVRAVAERDALVQAGCDEALHITVERALPRAYLLEQWRLAGMAECPAGATFAFEDDDLVAIGDQRRISKSGWPGTDDGDAFARRAHAGGKHQLLPGGTVDDTAELRAAAHFVDAGVAGKAAPHRLA